MTLLLVIAGLLMSSSQTAPTNAPSGEMVQTVDHAATARCMRDMVGFRNVPLRCVVGADGRLGECEVRTNNRAVLRYSRVYRCMASNVRVTLPDGSVPVGRSVGFRIHGSSFLSEATPPSGQ